MAFSTKYVIMNVGAVLSSIMVDVFRLYVNPQMSADVRLSQSVFISAHQWFKGLAQESSRESTIRRNTGTLTRNQCTKLYFICPCEKRSDEAIHPVRRSVRPL
jgi:hypothetical protein